MTSYDVSILNRWTGFSELDGRVDIWKIMGKQVVILESIEVAVSGNMAK